MRMASTPANALAGPRSPPSTDFWEPASYPLGMTCGSKLSDTAVSASISHAQSNRASTFGRGNHRLGHFLSPTADLGNHFGEEMVFIDVAAIGAGRDFVRAIEESVTQVVARVTEFSPLHFSTNAFSRFSASSHCSETKSRYSLISTIGSGSNWNKLSRPRCTLRTSPTFSNTRRCFVIAWRVNLDPERSCEME